MTKNELPEPVEKDTVLMFDKRNRLVGRLDLYEKLCENWKFISKRKEPVAALITLLNNRSNMFVYKLQSETFFYEDNRNINRNITPQCPECGSAEGSIIHCSTTYNENDPWSQVLKIFECEKCSVRVPAHIWECWGNQTLKQSKDQWILKFRKRSIDQ